MRDGHEAVDDRGALARRPVLVRAGLLGERVGQLADRALERGREEQCLPLARDLLDDAVDDGLEAHVEHAVGLVQDEDLDAAELDVAAGDQVFEAPGRGDDHVGLAGAGTCGPKPTPP